MENTALITLTFVTIHVFTRHFFGIFMFSKRSSKTVCKMLADILAFWQSFTLQIVLTEIGHENIHLHVFTA